MTVRRGTSNSNSRGSALDRRRRKQWLLDSFGDGIVVTCSFEECEEELTFDSVTIDRFPVPGCEGGRYVRGNIRPACAYHNSQDGGYLAHRDKVKAV